MNRIYKAVWSERAGTFVAVSEISKGRGKRSGSIVRQGAGLTAAVLAGGLLLSGGLAGAETPEDNAITFVAPNGVISFEESGSITFNKGGSISGLSNLTVSGSINASDLTLQNGATVAAGNMQAVTGGQLYQTNQNVAAAKAAADSANTAVGNLGTQLQNGVVTKSLNVGDSTLVVNSKAVTVGSGTTVNMGGNKIVNVAEGTISETSNEVVTGSQVHDLFFETGAGGVRYFHTKSTAADSEAEGDQSIAIGPNTVAGGASSFAAGDGAVTSETAQDSIALGTGAQTGVGPAGSDGAGSVAIGRDSLAAGTSTLALGDGARVEDMRVEKASALGSGAKVSGMFSDRALAVGDAAHASAATATALGASATASANGATAVGAAARASGTNGVALGNANVAAVNGIAVGTDAYVGSADSIALGSGAGVGTEGIEAGDRTSHIAIGTLSGRGVEGNQSMAIGFGAGSGVIGDDNIAIGTMAGTGTSGNNNIAIGVGANKDAGARAQAVAIGMNANAGTDSVALGYGAIATGTDTLAIGRDAQAGANGVALGASSKADGNSIALGRNSAALETDLVGAGFLTGVAAPGSAVSVGNTGSGNQRRIINVADGAQRYDAVNVGQLRAAQTSVANLVGGEVKVADNGSFGGYVIELTDTSGGTHSYTTVADAINAVSSGAISVLPGSAVTYNPTGSITVAAGQLGNEAVNVTQLNEAVAEGSVKYFSVNTIEPANRLNDGAVGTNSLAAGPASVASGNASVAIGHQASTKIDAANAIAVGQQAGAHQAHATAIGHLSNAYDTGGVAVGWEAVSRGQNSVVIGTDAQADPKSGGTVDNAIVVGTGAEATADNGIAIGESSLASEQHAIAQGYDAHSMADDAIAVGSRSRTTGVSSQAYGTDSHASAQNAQASGTQSLASGESSIATGTRAFGYASDGIAIGTDARSGIQNPLPEEAARNLNGIAIGKGTVAEDRNALALGVAAFAGAESATAIGDGARGTALNAFAAGTVAIASADNASALGHGASAQHAGAVALGSGSHTAAAVGTASSTIDKVTYNYAGTDPLSTVSVGQGGAERTITNVAAGRVESTSTDAINGSQLFQTNTAVTALGDNLDTAGTSIATALGGTSAYSPSTHTVTAGLSVRGNGYTNVQDALTYVGQGWNVSVEGGAPTNVAPGAAVSFANTDDNIDISRVGTALTFNLADNLTATSVTTGDTVLTNTGVAVGSQVALGNTGLLITGGPSVTSAGIDAGSKRITRVAPGEDLTDAVNVAQLTSLAATPLTFSGDSGADVSRNLGQTINLVGGNTGAALTDGNIGVVANGIDTLAIKLNQNIDLGSTGSLAIGDTLVNNAGMVVDAGTGSSTAINAGKIMVAANPTTGPANEIAIDGNTGTIGGLVNKTFDPASFKSGQAATEDQLKSVSDIANTGWTLTDGTTAANIGPGGTVNFQGDDNLTVTQTEVSGENVMTVALKENIDLGANGSVTAGNTLLNKDGISIDDKAGNATTTTASGVTVSGTGNAATNVQAGVVTVTGTAGTIRLDGSTGTIGGLGNKTFDPNNFTSGQAATEDQLKSVSELANAGWTVTDSGGNNATIRPGGEVAFLSGNNNLVVEQTGVDDKGVLEITLSEKIDLGVDGSIKAGGSMLDPTGLEVSDAGDKTTTTAAGTTVTGLTGVTTVGAGLMTIAGDSNTITLDGKAGTIGGLTNTTFDSTSFVSGQAATEDQLKQVSDIANSGWIVSTGGADTGAQVKPGNTVKFLNTDDNVEITRDGTDLSFKLANEISLSKVTAKDGFYIVGGPNMTVTGISAGNLRITNVAPGVDPNDAVNMSQLGDVKIDVGDLTDRVDGVEQDIGDLGNRAVKYDGAVGSAKNTITLEGADGTAITNVADGRIESGSRDAVNGGQIHDMGESVAKGMGGNSKFVDGKLVTELSVAGKTYNNVNSALGGVHSDLSDQISDVADLANAGWNVTDADGKTSNIGPNGQVTFMGDSNISVKQTGSDNQGRVEIKLSDDLTLKSITAIKLDAETITTNEIAINNGGPIINDKGIDMSGKRITNVADGVDAGDAVNVGQLEHVAGHLQGQVNDLRGDLRRQDKRLSAGVAAAMATASLPQAYLPGKTMMSMAAGTWSGESGMAVGFSGISDNGKWVYKLSGNATSRGDYGGAVGVGYQW